MVSYGISQEVQVFYIVEAILRPSGAFLNYAIVKQNAWTFPVDLYKGGLGKETKAGT